MASRGVARHSFSLHNQTLGINEFVFARIRVSSPRRGGQAMQGLLGEKIGEGLTADVHAWASGQVVKLFKSPALRRLGWHEAQKTDAIFAAGAPGPAVLGAVTLEGRFGIVLSRLDGPTLLQLVLSGAMDRGQAGAILAGLCHAVHKTPAPPDVLSLRRWMDIMLQSAGGNVPNHVATGVLALIDRLSPGDELCHTDIHPGNVIMTAEGPRLVDWTGSIRGPAALDLAFSHILLREFAAAAADDPERPRAVNAAMQAEYARLAGLSPAALTAAIEPYLPIVRVLLILGGAFPTHRERLMQHVEAELGRTEHLGACI
jgi:hypothetical protein